MKQLLLLVSLILLGLFAPKEIYKEQPSLADPNNPLSLTCPEYIPTEHNVNANPNFAKTDNRLNNVDQNWYSAAVENIMKEEYNISYSEELGSYQSPNRANNLRFTYHKDGFTAKPRETKTPLFDVNDRALREDEKKYEEIEDWSIELKVENGKWKVESEELRVESEEVRVESEEVRVESEKLKVESEEVKNVVREIRIANAGSPPSGGARGGKFEDSELLSADNKAWIETDNIRIDYTNTKEGMRQDFIVKEKISGDDGLQLRMNVNTDLKMNVSKDAVTFSSGKDGKDKMMYSSLKAWDANGKTLDAYFERSDEHQFAIVVDDINAVYPVTVDPLSSTPDWVKGGWYTSMRHIVMADAGDINLDGFSDVLISSPGEHTSLYTGYVAVYFGSSNGLTNDDKWQFKKLGSTVTEFARSVSGNCDINGDGYGDIIVGEPKYTNGQTDEGRIHVFYGSQGGLPDSADWVNESNIEWARLGYSVSTAGDYNGDGYDDVIVGAPGYPNNYLSAHGRVLIFLGSANGLSNGPVYSFINWLDGYTGMGNVVSCAGDINGDGYSDVIAGEPYWPPPPSRPGDNQYESNGRFWVSFGSPSGADYNSGRIGEDEYSLFGYSVSSAGDVNNDGFDDVLVGSPNFYEGVGNRGKTYLYFGSQNGLVDAWSLDNQDPGFGTSVSDAGDVNSDGYDDVIIGAHYTAWDNMTDTSNSSAYVFYGSHNGIDNTSFWKYQMSEFLFVVVSSAGDVNTDGYSDVLVGGLKFEEPYLNELWPWYYAFYGKVNRIQITPHIAQVLQYEEYYFNVSLRSFSGIPVPNAEMFVEIKGANAEILNGLSTDDSGNVEYFLIGYNTGIDTIIAHATNVFDTAFIFWDDPNPVEMLSFNSSTIQKDVTLNWSTSTELNNSGFEIQRAIENGKLKIENWNKIGFVSGSGTTNAPKDYSYADRNLETGKYKYRLKQLDFNGNFDYFELAEVVSIGIPDKYDLSQNYPNPFNPVTTINYDLPTDGIVTLKVYDILGRELKTLVNEMKTAGYHKIQLNAADLASGAYFYQMKAGDFVAVKKFVVLK